MTSARFRIFKGGSTLKIERNENELPADAIDALARMLYPAMREYFKSDDGQREFSEWQARKGEGNLHAERAKPE